MGFFLIEWYLSGKFCLQWFLLKSGVQSTWVIKLNWNKTGFLIVLLPFRFMFYIDAFYEVALCEWKNGPKSLRELYVTSPEPRSVVDLPVPVLWVGFCSAPETAAIREGWAPPVRAKHEGPLSHSKQGRDVIVPSLSCLQERGGILHVILFSCTHMRRKYNQALLGFEKQAGEKPQMWNPTEWKLCKDFVFQTCTWDLEYHKNVCVPL